MSVFFFFLDYVLNFNSKLENTSIVLKCAKTVNILHNVRMIILILYFSILIEHSTKVLG